MKLRYSILLCISILCIVLCVWLLIAYRNLPQNDGEALESLRDSIKEFETLPAPADGTDPAETVSADTVQPEIPEPAETTVPDSEISRPVQPEEETKTPAGSADTEVSPETPAVGTTAAKPVRETTTADKPTGATTPPTGPDSETETAAGTDRESTSAAGTKPAETTTTADRPSGTPVVSLNFEKLWKINPEICGWLEIPDTRIDYPVVQSPDNDQKYLKVAYNGSPYVGGALFTEATYNRTDFNDPVTVIYGHTMNSGMLFGHLQKSYSSASRFAENRKITLYLPGEVRQYAVFAAVPYEAVHLLHTYDFSNAYWYNSFFTDVGRIRAIGANFDRDSFPKAGDRVLILSVCLEENTSKRYLVMAVLEGDLADNADAQKE